MYGLWGSTYRFSSSVLSSLELWERDAAMPLTHRPATSGCSFPYERLENDSNDQERSQVQGSRSSANCAWSLEGHIRRAGFARDHARANRFLEDTVCAGNGLCYLRPASS